MMSRWNGSRGKVNKVLISQGQVNITNQDKDTAMQV